MVVPGSGMVIPGSRTGMVIPGSRTGTVGFTSTIYFFWEDRLMASASQSDSDVGATNSRTAIETLARLSEDAFEGDPDHSLLANPRDLREEDWTALPPGAGRSIADIVEHVA